jgi:RHH-type proline utilization regulon transcriptional repressor/proline dehydrogenase/delta 1-pyrroline-5-carboxylate dehydrogenase
LCAWLAADEGALLAPGERAVLCDLGEQYGREAIAGLRVALPGPTGEDNSLAFVPRDAVAGVAARAAGYLHQLLAALANGTRLVLSDEPLARAVRAAVPAPAREQLELTDAPLEKTCDLLLYDAAPEAADAWRVRLASREGPIAALLRPDPRYAASRLVIERTLTVNTAAAGGNASLMSLGG